jgi:hypothetical protein
MPPKVQPKANCANCKNVNTRNKDLTEENNELRKSKDNYKLRTQTLSSEIAALREKLAKTHESKRKLKEMCGSLSRSIENMSRGVRTYEMPEKSASTPAINTQTIDKTNDKRKYAAKQSQSKGAVDKKRKVGENEQQRLSTPPPSTSRIRDTPLTPGSNINTGSQAKKQLGKTSQDAYTRPAYQCILCGKFDKSNHMSEHYLITHKKYLRRFPYDKKASHHPKAFYVRTNVALPVCVPALRPKPEHLVGVENVDEEWLYGEDAYKDTERVEQNAEYMSHDSDDSEEEARHAVSNMSRELDLSESSTNE